MTDLERIHNEENLPKKFRNSWTHIPANIIAQTELEKSRALHTALEKCEPIKGTRIYLTILNN